MDFSQDLAKRRVAWGHHLSAWRQSGLTIAEYSRRNNISQKSLSYWSR